MKTLTIALAILGLLYGCATTQVAQYDPSPRAKKSSDYDVPILESHSLTQPYKVIGSVLIPKKLLRPVDSVIDEMKQKCRDLGGDTLIDMSITPPVSPAGITVYQAKIAVWFSEDQK